MTIDWITGLIGGYVKPNNIGVFNRFDGGVDSNNVGRQVTSELSWDLAHTAGRKSRVTLGKHAKHKFAHAT